MNTYPRNKKQNSRGVVLFIAAGTLLLQGIPALHAEELTDALNTVTEAVTQLTQGTAEGEAAQSESETETTSPEYSKRWEYIQEWLKGHPRVKEHLDTNKDGEIDREEFKKGRQLWKKRYHCRYPREYREYYGSTGRPADRPGFGFGRHGYHPRYFRRDYDNNPPGWLGGPGTNWENRPGPAGGPGASPNRFGRYRRFWRR